MSNEDKPKDFNKWKTGWVKSKLRQHSVKYPPRNEAFKLARKERGRYQCSECKELFSSKEVQLDHIEPVIDIKTGWVDFNTFIDRLFVDVDGWSVLCKMCHEHKTILEDSMRTYYNQEKKKK